MAAMYRALDRFFSVSDSGSTLGREVLAGVTTFLTMAYIVVVQPAVLTTDFAGNPTGMDFGAVLLATCLVAAASTIAMGLVARYPIALAPGMGQNFFFILTVIPAVAVIVEDRGWETTAWQVTLGVVFIAGVVFLLLSLLGVREAIVDAVSPSMKNAIAAGIGLFIAFVGFKNAGLIIADPGTLVKLNTSFGSPDLIVFFFGLIMIAVLHTLKVRGSILWGILATTLLAADRKSTRLNSSHYS